MTHSVRTAISLPREDFKHLESLRKKLDKSRSEIFQDAIRHLFRKFENDKLERRYVQGYRRKPENTSEFDAMLKASLPAFPKENW
ncbi:MAG: ribbon-helix-helix protein, CopG family [Elusimicrobia bacterium]|nr:ribbon-helix-helix protein, CopG family [Elusimicrobiota bacterium]